MTRMPELVALTLALIGLPAIPALGGGATDKRELRIEYDAAPTVTVRADALDEPGTEGEAEQFVGHYSGVVAGEASGLFAGSDVVCEFEGVAAPGQALSGGFTMVEDVAGRCLFTTENGDAAVAEWSCRTGALMTSDARCEGKVTWVEGTGRFAGITGEARFHSDLFLQPGDGYARWRGDWRIVTLAEVSH